MPKPLKAGTESSHIASVGMEPSVFEVTCPLAMLSIQCYASWIDVTAPDAIKERHRPVACRWSGGLGNSARICQGQVEFRSGGSVFWTWASLQLIYLLQAVWSGVMGHKLEGFSCLEGLETGGSVS